MLKLSPKELEIASLRIGGLTAKAIAERFSRSEETIQCHLKNIHHKLGVHKRSEIEAALSQRSSNTAQPSTARVIPESAEQPQTETQ